MYCVESAIVVCIVDCQGVTLSYVLRKVLRVVYYSQEAVYHQTYECGLVSQYLLALEI